MKAIDGKSESFIHFVIFIEKGQITGRKLLVRDTQFDGWVFQFSLWREGGIDYYYFEDSNQSIGSLEGRSFCLWSAAHYILFIFSPIHYTSLQKKKRIILPSFDSIEIFSLFRNVENVSSTDRKEEFFSLEFNKTQTFQNVSKNFVLYSQILECIGIVVVGYGLIILFDMLGRGEKKSLSSSFSKNAQTTVVDKSASFSADKLTTLRPEQRGAEKGIVLKVIEGLNQAKGGDIVWSIHSFDQKRTIAGFKARIQWYWRTKDMRVTLKISFASSYFRLINHLNQGDLFVEMEELNFQLSSQEKKELQERIEQILASSIEAIKARSYSDEVKKQSDCLKRFLQDVSGEFQARASQGKQRSNERVDKKLSKKYMLYPAPTAFAWNPLGGICITENKYPLHKKTFYGQPNTLRKYFQSARHDNAFSLRGEDSAMELGEANAEAIYDWPFEQEVDLLIFNKQKSFKRDDKYYQSRAKNQLEAQSKTDPKKEQEGLPLAYLNRLPSQKLRKVYQRHFGRTDRPSQFHRHDKLRVYEVRSLGRDHQDDIVYLFQRLALGEQRERLQVLFQNQLSGYPGLLQQMNHLKYRLLTAILTQNLLNPKLHFCTFLKIFILENEFLSAELERYFRQMYRVLNRLPHHQLFFLGSYNHFDSSKAELIFMNLLESTLEAEETAAGRRVGGLRVKRKVRLPRLNLQSVVGQAEKNSFLINLFPILIVKDREMQKFQFKQLKRIITANSKLFQFIRKANELVGKLEEGRLPFLRTLVENYRKYRELEQGEEGALQPRRIFFLHCRLCQHSNKLYDLASREDLQFCAKCKQKLLNDTP